MTSLRLHGPYLGLGFFFFLPKPEFLTFKVLFFSLTTTLLPWPQRLDETRFGKKLARCLNSVKSFSQ